MSHCVFVVLFVSQILGKDLFLASSSCWTLQASEWSAFSMDSTKAKSSVDFLHSVIGFVDNSTIQWLVEDIGVVERLSKSYLSLLHVKDDVFHDLMMSLSAILDFLARHSVNFDVQVICQVLLPIKSMLQDVAQSFLSREHAALMYYEIVKKSSASMLLAEYPLWLSIALLGIGDFDSVIRNYCTLAFRFIVPLSSVAKGKLYHPTANKTEQQDQQKVSRHCDVGCSLLLSILSRCPVPSLLRSSNEQDKFICKFVHQYLSCKRGGDDSDSDSEAMISLRLYQWEGISWLTHLRRAGLSGCLSDEMGLGKTLQCLVALLVYRLDCLCEIFDSFLSLSFEEISEMLVNGADRMNPFLLACPAPLVYHWENELLKFFPPINPLLRPERYEPKRRNAENRGIYKTSNLLLVLVS